MTARERKAIVDALRASRPGTGAPDESFKTWFLTQRSISNALLAQGAITEASQDTFDMACGN